MKKRLEALLQHALTTAIEGGALQTRELPLLLFEIPKDASFGDLACPVAMALARAERKAPRAIAEVVVRHLEDPDRILESTEIAGPGYINFRFSHRFWEQGLAAIERQEHLPPAFGSGRRILVEFVSANPTGPLTIGHGRNAVLGDAISRLLEETGHAVEREYYFNNAGRQMTLLGESVRARALAQMGDSADFPEGGYQGEYISSIAADLVAMHGEALRAEGELNVFKSAAEDAIFADIRRTLERVGIRFDHFFNEDTLYRSGAIEKVLSKLREHGLTADRDGAVWLQGEPLGLAKDRVLVKSTGEPAYRLPDIAYHEDKLNRGFDLLIDVLGADHIAEHEEVKAALRGLGQDADRVHGIIYQFVTLTRGGVQVKMSTRRAEYVTLDELLDEVGSDVVRVFFLTRRADSHLEFDLDLAKKQSADNPVFYIQYAHARVCSLERQADAAGVQPVPAAEAHLETLTAPEEMAVAKRLAQYADVLEDAARSLEPHRLVFYLIELAGEFHRFYNRHRVLTDDAGRTAARFYLSRAVRTIVRDGLKLLGVSAPETM